MDPVPAPPSYRLAAVDALSRRQHDLYHLLSSKPGVGPNPVLPTVEELKAYLEANPPKSRQDGAALRMSGPTEAVIDPFAPPPPPSYRLAAVDALSRKDEDVYRLLSSKPGGGPNPVVPTAEELKAYLEAKNPFWGLHQSALHVCCALGLREAVEVVMGSGEVEVDCVTDDGATPLFLASCYGHSDIVELLAEGHGADVNRERRLCMGALHNASPLFAAAKVGHTDTVQMLLSFGADPNYRRQHWKDQLDDTSVLEIACVQGHTTVVKALLSAGADPNSHRTVFQGQLDDRSVLSTAACKNRPSMASLLLEYGADPQYQRSYRKGIPHDPTELHTACRLGSAQCVRLLCDAGADSSARMTVWLGIPRRVVPLRTAAKFHQLGTIPVLLSFGADPFEVDEGRGVPVIDMSRRRRSACVLMDSRPSCM